MLALATEVSETLAGKGRCLQGWAQGLRVIALQDAMPRQGAQWVGGQGGFNPGPLVIGQEHLDPACR